MSLGRKNPFWRLTSWILALVLILPVLVMLIASIGSSDSLFSHLWQTVLPTYIENTIKLSAYVVMLALLFGIPSAALVTQTNIKGRQWLRWMLLLPLAMPAYLVAYLYTDLFDYAGPVQRFLRESFGWQSANDYWFFDIRTLFGASVVLALVLFPYVYMLTRTALEQQDRNLIRAGRTLGLSASKAFIQIGLPLARPAIMVSATLVMMETIADFATVQYFAVNTLTTAIYDTWLGYGDMAAANALASVLMLFVLFVVVAEQKSRAKQRHQSSRPSKETELICLSASQQALALSFCWFLVIAGFLLPITLLISMAIKYSDIGQFKALTDIGMNTLYVSGIAATISVCLAVFLSLYKRMHEDKSAKWPLQLSGFGYAVPGTVLAMALMATFAPIDHWLNDIAVLLSLEKPGLILSGTVFAIIFAFVVRFAAIANGTVSAGIDKIPASLDFAPATLGAGLLATIKRVHLPLLKPSILVAWLLVFVESMKELPAVLLLRPFNFETLSTFIYQLISDEQLEQGAIGAIFIVLFGLLPIIWLNKDKH
ncbi:ABC transporter permease [Thalassotalea atypica]|uniref:ABC transporter permease n=1 Tax=Thalassotalea atypica TaxID=2054316 RepID=UPI0025746395|nr:iron ABC transporter permease [Thalassotalea atypica]